MKNFLIAIFTLSALLLNAQAYISPKVYPEPMIIHSSTDLRSAENRGAEKVQHPGQLSRTSSMERRPGPADPSHFSSEGRTWAVIIGIGRYQRLSELKYADDDARRMYHLFSKQKHGTQSGNRIRLLLNEQATRDHILRTLQEVLFEAEPQDRVFIYYSGHGLPGAFTPTDYYQGKNAISHEKVVRLLNRCRAKYKLCIVDACHSGGMRPKGPLAGSATGLYAGTFSRASGGTALLLSSQAKEYSFECDDLKQGVFSHYLLRGLSGEADYNADKVVSISELYAFTYQEVSEYTKFLQFPVLSGRYDQHMAVGISL